MTEQRTGAVITMVILATFLASIGVWQFGHLGLGEGKKHTPENKYEYDEQHTQHDVESLHPVDTPELLNRIAATHNARIIEVERERERGRDLYEIELIGPDGRKYELKVDATSGEVIDRD